MGKICGGASAGRCVSQSVCLRRGTAQGGSCHVPPGTAGLPGRACALPEGYYQKACGISGKADPGEWEQGVVFTLWNQGI